MRVPLFPQGLGRDISVLCIAPAHNLAWCWFQKDRRIFGNLTLISPDVGPTDCSRRLIAPEA